MCCKKWSNWTSGVGQKNPTLTTSVVRNPTPSRNLRLLTTPTPALTPQPWLKWDFLWLQMISVSLNKQVKPSTKPTLPVDWNCHFYLQFKPRIWALFYPRKRTNCTISLHERYFPIPLRHTEKHWFYWNWATLTFAEFFTLPPIS